MDLGPKAEMREIRTSGLMSGIWKRDRLGHRARSRLYRAKALVGFSRSCVSGTAVLNSVPLLYGLFLPENVGEEGESDRNFAAYRGAGDGKIEAWSGVSWR